MKTKRSTTPEYVPKTLPKIMYGEIISKHCKNILESTCVFFLFEVT